MKPKISSVFGKILFFSLITGSLLFNAAFVLSLFGDRNFLQGPQRLQGEKGENGLDDSTPTIEISEDGYWVINGVETESKAVTIDGKDGANGLNGKNGKDAYQIYKDYYHYQGSYEDWINDLIRGNLTEKRTHLVTFDSNGGERINSQTVVHGEKATEPTTPKKQPNLPRRKKTVFYSKAGTHKTNLGVLSVIPLPATFH